MPKEESVAPLFDEFLQDLVLQEGCKCVFKARVTGLPFPQITWFKDGVPVQNTNADYKAPISKFINDAFDTIRGRILCE